MTDQPTTKPDKLVKANKSINQFCSSCMLACMGLCLLVYKIIIITTIINKIRIINWIWEIHKSPPKKIKNKKNINSSYIQFIIEM